MKKTKLAWQALKESVRFFILTVVNPQPVKVPARSRKVSRREKR